MTEKCQTHKDMLSTLSNDSWHRDPDRVESDWGQRRLSGTGPGRPPPPPRPRHNTHCQYVTTHGRHEPRPGTRHTSLRSFCTRWKLAIELIGTLIYSLKGHGRCGRRAEGGGMGFSLVMFCCKCNKWHELWNLSRGQVTNITWSLDLHILTHPHNVHVDVTYIIAQLEKWFSNILLPVGCRLHALCFVQIVLLCAVRWGGGSIHQWPAPGQLQHARVSCGSGDI